MRIRILFIPLILLTILSNAQVIQERVKDQIKILKQSKIDTFLIYYLTCNGRMPALDSCSYEEPQCLFWIHNNNTYVQKFDYCKNHSPLALDTVNPILFYLANKIKIDKEKIKPPTYFKSKKDKVSLVVDHDCFNEISFKIRNKSIFKTVSEYNLNFERFDNGRKNINFKYNQGTKLKKLIDILNKSVSKYDKE
jgi:hypothetical protein